MKDFTQQTTKVEFKLDSDTFYGVEELPAFAVLEFVDMDFSQDSNSGEMREVFTRIINLMLEPDSAALFLARLEGKKGKSIGVNTVKEIVPWLMEQYGLRPTQPSKESLDGSQNQEHGTNSTENTSEEE